MDVCQYRQHAFAASAHGLFLRLAQRNSHLPSRILSLGTGILPQVSGKGPCVPQEGAAELVPELPYRSGQRTGHRRQVLALRLRGGTEGSHAVVLPHHRLCRRAACRSQEAGKGLARPRAHHAAQLDRPLHRCGNRVQAGRPRGRNQGVLHPRRYRVRRDLHDACPRASAGGIPHRRS